APVRSAQRYIQERKGQMNYAQALACELPIGSGEVESGHRHVLQKRLKIAGAWWLTTHAEAMLQLRTVRANKDWDNYWRVAKN
ncbi:MAG: ISKra4 family transposase, partial [Chloroflexota bacterium]